MGLFTKKRAGIELTKEEVKQIKQGRKALRKELRANGIKSKKSFQIAAASRGLYFDDTRDGGFWWWLFGGKGLLLAALGAAAALGLMLGLSYINEMRGFMTVNLKSSLYNEGFVLSETADFNTALTRLYADVMVDLTDMSIYYLPDDLANLEGIEIDEQYFAYGFYIQNGGENTVGYTWSVDITAETLGVSEAVWLMVYENDTMLFYAKAQADGSVTCIPSLDETNVGYLNPSLLADAADQTQFEIIKQINDTDTFYRVYPIAYVDDDTMAEGTVLSIAPDEINKYTVVLWLEGDDPDCVQEIVGGSLGVEMNFSMFNE